MYDKVAAILRGRGHRVLTPTMTGLGERSHLLTSEINLSTHIQDTVNVLRFNELENVVLAGHSYGGMVITGAADREAERVASLVYLDGVIPADGQNLQETIAAMIQMGGDTAPENAQGRPPEEELGLGALNEWPMPPFIADYFKIPSDQRWKYTPQPFGCNTERIALSGAVNTIAKKTLVYTQHRAPQYRVAASVLSGDPAWRTIEIQTGHFLMLEDPERTAEILEGAI